MVSDQILKFYKSLQISATLPDGVSFMNPYQDKDAFKACSEFYQKFYGDTNSRTMILGINPGRFGGGITGVPFTDPLKLEQICGIPNDFLKKPELSADFIYQMIGAFGGAKKFYQRFFISAISPLGFVKDGKNLNYYDIRELQDAIEPFIIDCIEKQFAFGINREKCFCLGEGENYRYLTKLNTRYNFFKIIRPLPHPRFIMQYRRKQVDEYVNLYLEDLKI